MATVTVGCKLPNGLHLDYQDMRVTLNGSNSSLIIGAYGMTQVDKDFWDGWVAQYKDYAPVQQGLVFAQSSDSSAKSKAKEMSAVESGFERINPEKPGRGVEPATTE